MNLVLTLEYAGSPSRSFISNQVMAGEASPAVSAGDVASRCESEINPPKAPQGAATRLRLAFGKLEVTCRSGCQRVYRARGWVRS